MALFVSPIATGFVLLGTDADVSTLPPPLDITPLKRPDGAYLAGSSAVGNTYGIPLDTGLGSTWTTTTPPRVVAPRPATVEVYLQIRAHSGGAAPTLYLAVHAGAFTGTVGFLNFSPLLPTFDGQWRTFAAPIPGWETTMDPAAFDTETVWLELGFVTSTIDVSFAGCDFPADTRGARPLRQFPRDDSLTGNSAPRQGHSSRSVQASTRQGWRGTYR